MNSMHNKSITPPNTQGAVAQAEDSVVADAYELLTNDSLGLDFNFNGLQADLGLILDPLTPRRPLKGLLMDKGALAERAMAVEKILGQLSKGVAQLKTVHRQFAQKYKCHYVALNSIVDRGRSIKFYDEASEPETAGHSEKLGKSQNSGKSNKVGKTERAERIGRNLNALELEYPALQRNCIILHWRANKSLEQRTKGLAYECKFGRRVHLFEPSFSVEYAVVREVFTQDAPRFYEVLAAFEQIRVALNMGYKTYSLIGKDILMQLLEMEGGGEAHFPMTTRRQVQVLLEAMDHTGKTQDVLNRLAGLVL